MRMRKTVSLSEAAQIIGGGISMPALYHRVIYRGAIPLYSRRPIRLRLADVIEYAKTAPPVLPKPGRSRTLPVVMDALNARLARARAAKETVCR